MSEPITLESLDRRITALEDRLAADAEPAEPLIVWKDWTQAVGVITDVEGYAAITAAGQAIRQAERDEA